MQDLRIETETIRFRKEKFYSPRAGQTFLAPLPPGYQGQFGPELHSFLLSQYFAANVSAAKLAQLVSYFGVQISAGQIAHLLTEAVAPFHAESSAVLAAGLASSAYQQLDETSTRVNGQNYSCHVLTTPAYTAYRTTAGQDRLNVLRALTDQPPLGYLFNAQVAAYLGQQGLAAKWRTLLTDWPPKQVWSAAELTARLAGTGRNTRRIYRGQQAEQRQAGEQQHTQHPTENGLSRHGRTPMDTNATGKRL
ncbi:MAG: transposase [Chloroflexota bacterium]|nr:transposase [Chloroflexota bacterium]